jgi:hypothetical protein
VLEEAEVKRNAEESRRELRLEGRRCEAELAPAASL